MEYPYINYDEFDPSRIAKAAVESKTSKSVAGVPGVQYSDIKTDYCYSIKDAQGKSCDMTAQFIVKTPLLTSPDGISLKKMSNGNTSASLPTVFNFSDPEVMAFIKPREFGQDGKTVVEEGGFFDRLYYACVDRVNECRSQIPLLSRMGPDITSNFVPPLQWNRNVSTHQIDFTRPPRRYLPLVNYTDQDQGQGQQPQTSQYQNVTMNGQPAPERRSQKMTQFRSPVKLPNGDYFTYKWEDLMATELKYYGFLRIKKIYIGSKISIQLELESVVITNIKKIDTLGRQLSTLSGLEKNKETHSVIESQLRALGLLDKASSELAKAKDPKSEAKVAQPAQAGIMNQVVQPIQVTNSVVTNTGTIIPEPAKAGMTLPGFPTK